MYVQTVLDVHKKYNALVMSAFNNDAGFVAALDKVGMLTCGSVRDRADGPRASDCVSVACRPRASDCVPVALRPAGL